MKKEIINKISEDLKIDRYNGEDEKDYNCRVLYSAVGLWCLKLSLYNDDENSGISKNRQTTELESIIEQYGEIEPAFVDYMRSKGGLKASVRIRQIYESLGYIVTDDNNRNHLPFIKQSVAMTTDKALWVGVPVTLPVEMNGLGVFANLSDEDISPSEYISRDSVGYDDYIKNNYNICDFNERDISTNELEFFNPLLKRPPYESWEKNMATNFSVARKNRIGPYYRAIRDEEKMMFMAENPDKKEKGLFSEEYRRMYLALRAHYNNPLTSWVTRSDENHVTLSLKAKLPARESLFLRLVAWPIGNAVDTQVYLLRKEFLSTVKEMFSHIYITVKEFK